MVDATLGLGGHTEAVLTRCELARVVGIDRDPAALELAGDRLAASATGSPACTRSTTSCPRSSTSSASTPSTPCSSTSASPRCSSTSASAASPTREDAPLDMRMDGTTGPTAADVLNTYSGQGADPGAARVRRGAVRPQDRRRRRPAARARAVHHLGPPRRAAVRRDPGARAAYRRPPRQAHLPGAADGGQRRARACSAAPSRPPSTRSGSVAAWSWSPTTRSRTGWSSRRSPPSPGSDVPPDLPVVPEELQPAFRLVTRGAEQADADEVATNPRAASVRLRAVERIRPPTRGGACMSSPALQLAGAASRGWPRRRSTGPASPSSRGAGSVRPGCRS